MRNTIVLALLALAACQDEPAANNAAEPAAVTPAPGANAVAPAPQVTATTETAFPGGFIGHWGLVPGDCVEGASDAKGLMEVEGATLRFYESRGTAEKVAIDGNTASGEFAFTGEGQRWTNEVTLSLEDDGKTLVRREADLPKPLRYSRCPA